MTPSTQAHPTALLQRPSPPAHTQISDSSLQNYVSEVTPSVAPFGRTTEVLHTACGMDNVGVTESKAPL